LGFLTFAAGLAAKAHDGKVATAAAAPTAFKNWRLLKTMVLDSTLCPPFFFATELSQQEIDRQGIYNDNDIVTISSDIVKKHQNLILRMF